MTTKVNPTESSFSPGQALEMSDSERLVAPAFEELPSGAACDGIFPLAVPIPEILARDLARLAKKEQVGTEYFAWRLIHHILDRASEATIDNSSSLVTLQRLFRLSASTAAVEELLEKGFHSASDIARESRGPFVRSLGGSLSLAEARLLHEAAIVLCGRRPDC